DPRPLFAEGKAVPAEAWRCHSWNNCPLHHAYGASAVRGLPRRLRSMARLWLALYDGRHPCALRGLAAPAEDKEHDA
ncbi:MAG: hypothetical protein LDL44_12420, partial [Caenispirillum sp.]|nr:hypothetical protein [Caenispirillum sp.]